MSYETGAERAKAMEATWNSLNDKIDAQRHREVSERLAEYFPRVALTSRETEVLGLVADGLGNKEIAERLGIASGTVKIHIQNILDKLGAVDRTQAVTIAIQRGVLHIQ